MLNINDLTRTSQPPAWIEPKKIGFIFTTKITKEKKNKIYNLRALRVLRGVIKLFLPQNAHNLQLVVP